MYGYCIHKLTFTNENTFTNTNTKVINKRALPGRCRLLERAAEWRHRSREHCRVAPVAPLHCTNAEWRHHSTVGAGATAVGGKLGKQ